MIIIIFIHSIYYSYFIYILYRHCIIIPHSLFFFVLFVCYHLCYVLPYSVFSVTKMVFAVNIFVSYLIQFYVPLDFLEPYIFKLFKTNYLEYRFPRHSELLKSIVQYGFRTVLVILTGQSAICIKCIK